METLMKSISCNVIHLERPDQHTVFSKTKMVPEHHTSHGAMSRQDEDWRPMRILSLKAGRLNQLWRMDAHASDYLVKGLRCNIAALYLPSFHNFHNPRGAHFIPNRPLQNNWHMMKCQKCHSYISNSFLQVSFFFLALFDSRISISSNRHLIVLM